MIKFQIMKARHGVGIGAQCGGLEKSSASWGPMALGAFYLLERTKW